MWEMCTNVVPGENFSVNIEPVINQHGEVQHGFDQKQNERAVSIIW